MRKEKGITLVSLVVTIIILIILAGVSINLTLGKNGIITIAKQAKENTELAKIEEETALNELYMQIEAKGGTSGDISYDAIAKLTEFKTAIANYIEEAGGVKPETTSDTATFGDSIKGIVKEVTKNATATADNITAGKTAWVNGELITGKITNFDNSMNFTLSTNSSYENPDSNNRYSYGRINIPNENGKWKTITYVEHSDLTYWFVNDENRNFTGTVDISTVTNITISVMRILHQDSTNGYLTFTLST